MKDSNRSEKFLENLAGKLSLGRFLNAIRLGEKESQVDFAAKLGLSRSHLCDIENGRKLLSPERAARFANILRYSQKQFVRLALQDQVDKAGLKYNIRLS